MIQKSPQLQTLVLLLTIVVVVAAPVSLAGKGKTPGGGSCKGRNCDTRPPSVVIADPTTGEAIGGTASVAGSASDNGEILAVSVSVDGASPEAADGTTAWYAAVDTTRYSDGSHLITVTATDLAGNVGAASVSVDVSNPVPPPASSDPAPSPSPSPAPSPTPAPGTPVSAPSLPPATIGGYVFSEDDRDGIYETDERALTNQHLFLFDGTGSYLRNTYSDATGWYQFTDLPDGAYSVEFAPAAWWEIRADLVPDTTGTLLPRQSVTLTGTARADLGWRPIVRSTDPTSPISTFAGPSGLKVESYNDVVTAREIHDRLVSGQLVGSEAAFVTVRFDLESTGSTSTMATATNGVYDHFHATSNVSYVSWLDGDNELFHEYGHAWSLYHAYMIQQDPAFSSYLQARGLVGDPRLNSSYAWNVRELVAEDYRQLFGTPSAASGGQLNRDLPAASEVAGLRDFLMTTFTAPPED